ncbi:Hypothetical predicted protein [Paramuricea clavata]|uniref:Uncharacterized protein n=1 Tax=Paramuricea clavata TaxID=317549 RepID=A0A7D9I0W4_PARCT|nr:Hypothetical predicted protein [Paramuricea clavata]
MVGIQYPEFLYCYDHAEDNGVRMMLNNLVCGIETFDVFVRGDTIRIGKHTVPSNTSPEEIVKLLTDYVGKKEVYVKKKVATRVHPAEEARTFIRKALSKPCKRSR